MLAPHQRSNIPDVIGNCRNRQRPARAIKTTEVAMTGTCADDMRGDEEPWSFNKSAIERVAQIDRWPIRIYAAKIAQRRKTRFHVFARETKSFERLGCGRLERL